MYEEILNILPNKTSMSGWGRELFQNELDRIRVLKEAGLA
jgi:hypothetical protein